MLKRLQAYNREMTNEGFWVDPDHVTCIHPAGVLGCSVVSGTWKTSPQIVCGSPDDVAAMLWDDTTAQGRVIRSEADQAAFIATCRGTAGLGMDGKPLPPAKVGTPTYHGHPADDLEIVRIRPCYKPRLRYAVHAELRVKSTGELLLAATLPTIAERLEEVFKPSAEGGPTS